MTSSKSITNSTHRSGTQRKIRWWCVCKRSSSHPLCKGSRSHTALLIARAQTWHQGGPGASSVNLGLYTEMGYFNTDDQGTHVNPDAWNSVANMLYLESPAGSGLSELSGQGTSACYAGGKMVGCHWDDKSQAEAYAHTLLAVSYTHLTLPTILLV